MSKFLKEFKEFAMKGNVMDMAIGVIIGAAFGAIVTSLVGDLIMPLISWATGGIDFAEWRIALRAAVEATETTEAVEGLYISYGKFINVLFNFIIIAFSIFLVIKGVNKMSNKFESEKAKKAKEAAEAEAKAAAEAPAPESISDKKDLDFPIISAKSESLNTLRSFLRASITRRRRFFIKIFNKFNKNF